MNVSGPGRILLVDDSRTNLDVLVEKPISVHKADCERLINDQDVRIHMGYHGKSQSNIHSA